MNEFNLKSVSCYFFVKSKINSSLTLSSSFVSQAYAIALEAVLAIFSLKFSKNLIFSFSWFSDFSIVITKFSISYFV